MTTRRKSKYPEVIASFAEILAALLHEKGLGQAEANEIAFDAAEGVRRDFGGQLIYIPRGAAFDRDERDEEIYRKFDGNNQNELAVEYGLSVQHIYRILAKVRSAMRDTGNSCPAAPK